MTGDRAQADSPAAVGALFNATYLKSLSFTAKTIIDVGVRKGTPELYQAFPKSDFILVDPQKGGESLLEHKPERYTFVNKGLGASPGSLFLDESAALSSLLERTQLTAATVKERYLVEITTIDHLLGSMSVEGPVGLKIDTEGYELEVVKGINGYWPDIEFIICEASVRKRFENSYQFSELVSYLHSKSFAFFNILNNLEKRPRFYDVLFVRSNSNLLK